MGAWVKGGEERLGVCRAAMTSLEGGADTVQQREPVSGSRNHGHIGLFSVRKNDPEIILVVGMNGSERVVECTSLVHSVLQAMTPLQGHQPSQYTST